MTTATHWRHAVLGTVLAAAAVLAQPATGTAAPPAQQQAAARKVDPALRAQAAKADTTFWVVLDTHTDLAPATGVPGKKAKADYVYRSKVADAERSQAGLRKMLSGRKAPFTPYWIANTVKVTGDRALIDAVAARPEVAGILPDAKVQVPAPKPAATIAADDGVEWNIDRVNAPRVWHDLGVQGANVVVANIDTGVDVEHPALAASYRGRRADGSVDNNYNWFDPAHVCPGAGPCDNNGHGTHTMGTMVGHDGPAAIGVAPGARWIAAKGCESSYCSTASLLAAGQWILAPTDSGGANPRPDLAPDVVNNSWGNGSYDPWYRQIVESWVAAGIFPAFSNGNSGPSCRTSGSPGTYSVSYSSGAFDSSNAIASFSSRGAGENDDIKPNIAAPGVNVRSSVPGGQYASYSGTSMASPHTAATVALIWSAVPALRGDVAQTREILDSTAIDVADTSCGGTAEDNNVWGQGRLDAYAAVSAARTPAGSLTGSVTADGAPVAGATVTVAGPARRSAVTDAGGHFRIGWLPVGGYTVTASAFGYVGTGTPVRIADHATASAPVTLARVPSAVLSGRIRSASLPAAGATVAVLGTPLSTTTDAAGRYRLVVPVGSYDLRVSPADSCATAVSRHVDLTADTTVALGLPAHADRFGHTCRPVTGGYLAGTDALALSGDDSGLLIDTPFPVHLYGTSYRQAWISTNGFISFAGQPTAYGNGPIPDAVEPNAALYPFWDDLVVDDQAGVYTATLDDTFVVEWRNVRFYADVDQRVSVSAAIRRDGTVTYRYRGLTPGPLAAGMGATIGMENADGTDALAYSVDSQVVRADSGVTFPAPGSTETANFAPIEAESFDAEAGSHLEACADTGGGADVGLLANGDWLRYDAVDFGTVPARQFVARVASGADGVSGLVQVRLDSPDNAPVGDFSIADTGGWQSWRTVPGSLAGVTGVHTVYLTFSSGQPANFVNLNWFVFTP